MWETTSNGPTDHLWFMFLFRTYCRKWNDWDLPFLSFAFSNLWLMEDSRLLLESVTAFSTPGRGGREYGSTHGTVHWKLTGTLQCCLPSSTVMHWKKKVFKRSRLHIDMRTMRQAHKRMMSSQISERVGILLCDWVPFYIPKLSSVLVLVSADSSCLVVSWLFPRSRLL